MLKQNITARSGKDNAAALEKAVRAAVKGIADAHLRGASEKMRTAKEIAADLLSMGTLLVIMAIMLAYCGNGNY